VIGRFLTIDPEKQFASAYLGMGNNPIIGIDPTGGKMSPIFDESGRFLGTDSERYTGDIVIMNKILYNNLTNNGERVLDHNFVMGIASNGVFANFLSTTDMSLAAKAQIYTHVLNQMEDVDFSSLFNGSVSIFNNYSRNGVYQGYNSPDYVIRYSANVDLKKININDNYIRELSTVEIIQNYLGVHEWQGHIVKKFNNGWDHYKIYNMQQQHHTYNKLPKGLQNEIIDRNDPSFR